MFTLFLGIFLSITVSISALGPTQPPIQWVPGVLSLGVNRPGREADHPPPSSAEDECVELYFHSPIRLHDTGTNLPYLTFMVATRCLRCPYDVFVWCRGNAAMNIWFEFKFVFFMICCGLFDNQLKRLGQIRRGTN
jgi:hypothetical protein